MLVRLRIYAGSPEHSLFAYVSRSITKPTEWHVRHAKTQICLGICPVWPESSLCAQREAKDLSHAAAHVINTHFHLKSDSMCYCFIFSVKMQVVLCCVLALFSVVGIVQGNYYPYYNYYPQQRGGGGWGASMSIHCLISAVFLIEKSKENTFKINITTYGEIFIRKLQIWILEDYIVEKFLLLRNYEMNFRFSGNNGNIECKALMRQGIILIDYQYLLSIKF